MTNQQNECVVEGCTNVKRGAGEWCNKHRQRARRYYGDPLGKPAEYQAMLHERLHSKLVRNEEGCLIYTGATQKGYGVISDATGGQRKARKPHRVAYEEAFGPIPDGLEIDHECHNIAYREGRCAGGDTCRHRACCEPTHLVPRTRWENTGRGGAITAINARKDECPKHEEAYEIIRICRHCQREAEARHRQKQAAMVLVRDEPTD